MITTAITAVGEAERTMLKTAAGQGIRYYKPGYFRYTDLAQWKESIETARAGWSQIAKVNAELDLRAGLHNHAGDSVGCSIWDGLEALNDTDPARAGFYFDPAQAAIEGGKLGWNLGFRRVAPRLFMVAIKDFVWEKTDRGWRTRWVPLGQGMVDWATFFPMLKRTPFPGPISLHIEYDPGGRTQSERYDRALEAASLDLTFLRRGLS